MNTGEIIWVDIGISSDIHWGIGVVLSQGFHHSSEGSQGQYELVVLATSGHVHTDVGTGGQTRDGHDRRRGSTAAEVVGRMVMKGSRAECQMQRVPPFALRLSSASSG